MTEHYVYVDGEYWDRVSNTPQQVAKSLDAAILAVWDKRNAKGAYIDKEVKLITKPITYRRPPTAQEVSFGHGATHYRDFEPSECRKGDYTLKRWFKSPDDNLNYYRG